ncbi:hypothetical protein LEP1GSC059_0120 [Leptospira noguchii serovar Panama str. CZ214]|uniref:Uncharacterized protein n=1 Tax=Leptospira noguchii serovar Panama str. CZ214 TaxID=1001595 RepID=T0GW90_9LEPT|nr:hypothetical protein LEP1GSC059_0120 [Leptospira noguchii serovar Panama str. CZ214]
MAIKSYLKNILEFSILSKDKIFSRWHLTELLSFFNNSILFHQFRPKV